MAIKHALFTSSGYLPYSSLTTSYQTILTMEDDADGLIIACSYTTPFYISIPNETGSSNLLLPDSTSLVLDLKANNKMLAKGVIQAKALSALPTSGILTVTAFR